MSLFTNVSELRIGSIIEVSGSSIKVDLDKDINDLTRTYKGRVYPIGQFASVVKIPFGRRMIFAYVRMLRMRSDIALEEGQKIPSDFEDSRVLEADLFGEGIWKSSTSELEFSRGVKNYPLPGQSVLLTTEKELTEIYKGSEKENDSDFSEKLGIGNYVGSEGTTCYADFDKLMGLHSAILGSTGSGKSGTVAALIHSILEHEPVENREDNDRSLSPNIVLLDPHGEYAKAFKNQAVIYKTDISEISGNEKPLKLPYWLYSSEQFRKLVIGKTEYEATSEHNIVHKALKHARLVEKGIIKEAQDWIGKKVADTVEKPDEPKPLDGYSDEDVASYDRDTPDPFYLEEFEDHIIKEQAIRIKSKKWQKKSPSKLVPYSAVLDKLSVLKNDPRLDFMMNEYKDDDLGLEKIIEQLVGCVQLNNGKKANLKIVDLSGLPNEVAGPLTANISRLLFQYKLYQNREERERDPVLLVCEEAHRYVPDSGRAEYESAQKAIKRIAKEGRKYGLGLMLVSQRPSDVERTVLSQCNSWIVLRLTNSSDQEHVNRFLPDSLAGLSRLLPSLTRQEAIFVGQAASIPARIRIRTLGKDQLPKSEDISFINGWSQASTTNEEISKVVRRWRGEM